MSTRKMAVAGQFYPADYKDIQEMFKHYNEILDKSLTDTSLLDISPRAVIVPHAGYVYSGFTANVAFRMLKNSASKHVAVIGPSHRVYLQGTSVCEYDNFETPMGLMQVDKNLADILMDKFDLYFQPDAHHEHSTEVQMPFIKTYLGNTSVVELVYGDENPKKLAEVIGFLLQDHETTVVISTDLSHYYDIRQANSLDNICLKAVDELDPSILHKGCEACGIIGVEAMLIAAKRLGLKSVLLDYRTSADASGDKSQVVGYMSAAFVEEV